MWLQKDNVPSVTWFPTSPGFPMGLYYGNWPWLWGFYYLQVMRSIPPMYGRSASGMRTDPSAC